MLTTLSLYVTDEPFNRITITDDQRLVYDKWLAAPKEILHKACSMVKGKFDIFAFGDGLPTPIYRHTHLCLHYPRQASHPTPSFHWPKKLLALSALHAF